MEKSNWETKYAPVSTGDLMDFVNIAGEFRFGETLANYAINKFQEEKNPIVHDELGNIYIKEERPDLLADDENLDLTLINPSYLTTSLIEKKQEDLSHKIDEKEVNLIMQDIDFLEEINDYIFNLEGTFELNTEKSDFLMQQFNSHKAQIEKNAATFSDGSHKDSIPLFNDMNEETASAILDTLDIGEYSIRANDNGNIFVRDRQEDSPFFEEKDINWLIYKASTIVEDWKIEKGSTEGKYKELLDKIDSGASQILITSDYDIRIRKDVFEAFENKFGKFNAGPDISGIAMSAKNALVAAYENAFQTEAKVLKCEKLEMPEDSNDVKIKMKAQYYLVVDDKVQYMNLNYDAVENKMPNFIGPHLSQLITGYPKNVDGAIGIEEHVNVPFEMNIRNLDENWLRGDMLLQGNRVKEFIIKNKIKPDMNFIDYHPDWNYEIRIVFSNTSDGITFDKKSSGDWTVNIIPENANEKYIDEKNHPLAYYSAQDCGKHRTATGSYEKIPEGIYQLVNLARHSFNQIIREKFNGMSIKEICSRHEEFKHLVTDSPWHLEEGENITGGNSLIMENEETTELKFSDENEKKTFLENEMKLNVFEKLDFIMECVNITNVEHSFNIYDHLKLMKARIKDDNYLSFVKLCNENLPDISKFISGYDGVSSFDNFFKDKSREEINSITASFIENYLELDGKLFSSFDEIHQNRKDYYKDLDDSAINNLIATLPKEDFLLCQDLIDEIGERIQYGYKGGTKAPLPRSLELIYLANEDKINKLYEQNMKNLTPAGFVRNFRENESFPPTLESLSVLYSTETKKINYDQRLLQELENRNNFIALSDSEKNSRIFSAAADGRQIYVSYSDGTNEVFPNLSVYISKKGKFSFVSLDGGLFKVGNDFTEKLQNAFSSKQDIISILKEKGFTVYNVEDEKSRNNRMWEDFLDTNIASIKLKGRHYSPEYESKLTKALIEQCGNLSFRDIYKVMARIPDLDRGEEQNNIYELFNTSNAENPGVPDSDIVQLICSEMEKTWRAYMPSEYYYLTPGDESQFVTAWENAVPVMQRITLPENDSARTFEFNGETFNISGDIYTNTSFNDKMLFHAFEINGKDAACFKIDKHGIKRIDDVSDVSIELHPLYNQYLQGRTSNEAFEEVKERIESEDRFDYITQDKESLAFNALLYDEVRENVKACKCLSKEEFHEAKENQIESFKENSLVFEQNVLKEAIDGLKAETKNETKWNEIIQKIKDFGFELPVIIYNDNEGYFGQYPDLVSGKVYSIREFEDLYKKYDTPGYGYDKTWFYMIDTDGDCHDERYDLGDNLGGYVQGHIKEYEYMMNKHAETGDVFFYENEEGFLENMKIKKSINDMLVEALSKELPQPEIKTDPEKNKHGNEVSAGVNNNIENETEKDSISPDKDPEIIFSVAPDGKTFKAAFLKAPDAHVRGQLENVGFKYSVAAKAWKSEMTKENLSGLLTIIKKSYPSDFDHCKKEAEDIFLGKTEEKKPEVKKEKETLIDYSGMENTCANFIKNIRYVNSAFPQYKGNLAHILSDIIKSASTEERIGMLAIFKGCKNKDELNKTLQEIVYRPEEINQNKNVKLDMSKKQSVEQSDKDTLGR